MDEFAFFLKVLHTETHTHRHTHTLMYGLLGYFIKEKTEVQRIQENYPNQLRQ